MYRKSRYKVFSFDMEALRLDALILIAVLAGRILVAALFAAVGLDDPLCLFEDLDLIGIVADLDLIVVDDDRTLQDGRILADETAELM